MADAKIKLPGGAVVDVTGTAEEVARVLQLLRSSPSDFGGKREGGIRRKRSSPTTRKMESGGDGLRGHIREMKDEGFFKKNRRGMNEVKAELAARGHHYPDSSIASRLLELVKARELGRVKEKGKWLYVHRGGSTGADGG